jgi:hypothetical protein
MHLGLYLQNIKIMGLTEAFYLLLPAALGATDAIIHLHQPHRQC